MVLKDLPLAAGIVKGLKIMRADHSLAFPSPKAYRTLQLTGQLNDSHITALLELARKRQAEPIDLADDSQGRSTTTSRWDGSG